MIKYIVYYSILYI